MTSDQLFWLSKTCSKLHCVYTYLGARGCARLLLPGTYKGKRLASRADSVFKDERRWFDLWLQSKPCGFCSYAPRSSVPPGCWCSMGGCLLCVFSPAWMDPSVYYGYALPSVAPGESDYGHDMRILATLRFETIHGCEYT
jgi:hypothetical protein